MRKIIKNTVINGRGFILPNDLKESDAKTIARLMTEIRGATFYILLKDDNFPDLVTNYGVVVRKDDDNHVVAFTTQFNANDVFSPEIVGKLKNFLELIGADSVFGYRVFLASVIKAVELTGWPMVIRGQFVYGGRQRYVEDWFSPDIEPAKRWWQFWRWGK